MVEPGEMVLSDVHVRSRFSAVGEKQSTLTSSRFPFRVRETNASANRGPDSVIDSDVVVIQHSLQTTLKEVKRHDSCMPWQIGMRLHCLW